MYCDPSAAMTKSKLLVTVAKTLALALGGSLTMVSLMAVAGVLVDSGWARLAMATAVALVVPAFIADRLLPGDSVKNTGVVTDTFALVWMGFGFLFVGLAISYTGDLLREQAQDFSRGGQRRLAAFTAWVAGPAVASAETVLAPTTGSLPAIEALDAGAPDAGVPVLATATPTPPTLDAGALLAPPVNEKTSYTPAELFKEWSPAVVTITTRQDAFGMGGGTGFVIDDTGILVTNHHVIDNASSVSVKLLDGKWASNVELLVQDEHLDLAILKITTDETLKVVVLGDSQAVQVGERAISIGNPLGLEHTLTDGVVSARRTLEGKKMIQMSTPISPGNSGGPLFNLKGEVIGVSTATLSGGYGGAQNLNLAIPINEVKGLLRDDYPDRKRIGGGSAAGKGSW